MTAVLWTFYDRLATIMDHGNENHPRMVVWVRQLFMREKKTFLFLLFYFKCYHPILTNKLTIMHLEILYVQISKFYKFLSK